MKDYTCMHGDDRLTCLLCNEEKPSAPSEPCPICYQPVQTYASECHCLEPEPAARASSWQCSCNYQTMVVDRQALTQAEERIAYLEKQSEFDKSAYDHAQERVRALESELEEAKHLAEKVRKDTITALKRNEHELEFRLAEAQDCGKHHIQRLESEHRTVSEERDELLAWQAKAKHEMEQMNNGRPSEWAYSILRKERDELKAQVEKLRQTVLEGEKQVISKLNDTSEVRKRIRLDSLMEQAEKLREALWTSNKDDLQLETIEALAEFDAFVKREKE